MSGASSLSFFGCQPGLVVDSVSQVQVTEHGQDQVLVVQTETIAGPFADQAEISCTSTTETRPETITVQTLLKKIRVDFIGTGTSWELCCNNRCDVCPAIPEIGDSIGYSDFVSADCKVIAME